MRVCVLADGYEPFERGGAQRVAARLAEGYVGRGHEVTAITTAPTLGERGRSVRNGVEVRRVFTPRTDRLLPYLSVCNPYAEMRVGQILDDVAPDVVAPLRVGGGVRIKILESMAWGAPVVTTRAGFEGVEATPGEELVVADAPSEFVEGVVDLLDDLTERRRLGENARKRIEETYAIPAVSESLASNLGL